MLETLFLVATALLGALFALMLRERTNGVRYAPALREKLDRLTLDTVEKIKLSWKDSLHFLERNVLLKGLHMVTYIALVQVRFAERKLVQLSQKLRTFRMDHHVLRRSTHKLTQWTEEHREGEER
jgi:hypothetical protein